MPYVQTDTNKSLKLRFMLPQQNPLCTHNILQFYIFFEKKNEEKLQCSTLHTI